MDCNKRFKSGCELRLARILDNDIKIIIPDLQRDYCWGDTMCQNEPNKSLAEKFAEDLVENFKNKKDDTLSLGLLYGYEVPAGHIQLCDGQQRITTLYLLLGLLNRRTHTLSDRLISQRELDDSSEPYLQFAIRESTLYFMTDLVNHFFLANENMIKVSDIKKQGWYFKDYDNDPTIISMIKTLNVMENIVNQLQGDEQYHFAYYLCHNIRFIYYDMQTRRQGEETFVIINTKGEPLSATENIKPSLIHEYCSLPETIESISEKWEEWEAYFWKNRGNGNDTADAGMAEFFKWVSMLKYIENDYHKQKEETKEYKKYNKLRQSGELHFDIGLFKFNELEAYFNIVKQLFEQVDYLKEDSTKYLSPVAGSKVNQMDWYRILPLIKYLKLHSNATPRDIKRFSEFLKHTSNVMITRKNIEHVLPSILEKIKFMQSADILTLRSTGVSGMLFTDEVNEKFELCSSIGKNRDDYEDELWKAEDDPRWCGEIMPLINWAKRRTKEFDLQEFCRYRETFNNLFNSGHNLDLLRRVLLSSNAPDYPCLGEKFVRSLTNMTFGSNKEDWREVIHRNEDVFGDILEKLFLSANYDTTLNNLLSKNLSNVSNRDWWLMSSCSEFLEATEQKKIQIWDSNIVLIQRGNAANAAYLHSYNWYLYARTNISNLPLPSGWELQGHWWDRYGGCTYFEHKDNQTNITYCIDVAWRPHDYDIYYFCKVGGNTETDCKTKASTIGMDYDKSLGRYHITRPLNYTQHIINDIRKLM